MGFLRGKLPISVLIVNLLLASMAFACVPFDGSGFSGRTPDCYEKEYSSPGVLHVWTPGDLPVEVSCFGGESGTDLTHAIGGGPCTFSIADEGFYTVNTFFSSASPSDYGAGCSGGEEFCVGGRHYKCFSAGGKSAMLEDGACDACSIPCTVGESRCFGGSAYRCEGAPCLQWKEVSDSCGGAAEGGTISWQSNASWQYPGGTTPSGGNGSLYSGNGSLAWGGMLNSTLPAIAQGFAQIGSASQVLTTLYGIPSSSCDWETYYAVKAYADGYDISSSGEMTLDEYGLWYSVLDGTSGDGAACSKMESVVWRAENPVLAAFADQSACSAGLMMTNVLTFGTGTLGALAAGCKGEPLLDQSLLPATKLMLAGCKLCGEKFGTLQNDLYYLVYPEERVLQYGDTASLILFGVGIAALVACPFTGVTCVVAGYAFAAGTVVGVGTNSVRLVRAVQKGDEWKAAMSGVMLVADLLPGACAASKTIRAAVGKFGTAVAIKMVQKGSWRTAKVIAEAIHAGKLPQGVLSKNVARLMGVGSEYGSDAVSRVLKWSDSVGGVDKVFKNGAMLDELIQHGDDIVSITKGSADDIFEITYKTGSKARIVNGVLQTVEEGLELTVEQAAKRSVIVTKLVARGANAAKATEAVNAALKGARAGSMGQNALFEEVLEGMAKHADKDGFMELIAPLATQTGKGGTSAVTGVIYNMRVADDVIREAVANGRKVAIEFEPAVVGTDKLADILVKELDSSGTVVKKTFIEAKNGASSADLGQLDGIYKQLPSNGPNAEYVLYTGGGRLQPEVAEFLAKNPAIEVITDVAGVV